MSKELIKRLNVISGSFIIISNLILFIPYTIYIIYIGSGTWGFGLLFIPHCIIGTLFLTPAIMSLRKTNRDKIGLLVFNIS